MTDEKNQFSRAKDNHWKNIEIVRPGEDFLLFEKDRERTQIRYADGGKFGGLKSSIRLETQAFGILNLSISAAPYIKERNAVITPFDLKQGYTVDQNDFSLQRRVAKINKIRRDPTETIEGLYIFVYVAYEDILSDGWARAFLSEPGQAQESEKAALLQRLFLTLKFPHGLSFTAQAQINTPRGFLLFRTFFPSDTGPLPKVGHLASPSPKQLEDRTDGFDLILPFDLAKVQTVQARFFFLTDQEG